MCTLSGKPVWSNVSQIIIAFYADENGKQPWRFSACCGSEMAWLHIYKHSYTWGCAVRGWQIRNVNESSDLYLFCKPWNVYRGAWLYIKMLVPYKELLSCLYFIFCFIELQSFSLLSTIKLCFQCIPWPYATLEKIFSSFQVAKYHLNTVFTAHLTILTVLHKSCDVPLLLFQVWHWEKDLVAVAVVYACLCVCVRERKGIYTDLKQKYK